MTIFNLAGVGLFGAFVLAAIAGIIKLLGYPDVCDILARTAACMMISGLGCFCLFCIVNW